MTHWHNIQDYLTLQLNQTVIIAAIMSSLHQLPIRPSAYAKLFPTGTLSITTTQSIQITSSQKCHLSAKSSAVQHQSSRNHPSLSHEWAPTSPRRNQRNQKRRLRCRMERLLLSKQRRGSQTRWILRIRTCPRRIRVRVVRMQRNQGLIMDLVLESQRNNDMSTHITFGSDWYPSFTPHILNCWLYPNSRINWRTTGNSMLEMFCCKSTTLYIYIHTPCPISK